MKAGRELHAEIYAFPVRTELILRNLYCLLNAQEKLTYYFTGMQSCVSPISDKSIREIQTGDHFINVLELWKNGDTVPRSLTKNGFIDSLEELRLPLRDLRMLVKSSDTIRTRFPSLLPRPSSKCYIFEIEHIRFLCFRRASLPTQSFLNHLCPPHLS